MKAIRKFLPNECFFKRSRNCVIFRHKNVDLSLNLSFCPKKQYTSSNLLFDYSKTKHVSVRPFKHEQYNFRAAPHINFEAK